MSAHSEIYKDCTIKIMEDGQLSIDKKPIDCNYDSAEKMWYSRYLPYSQYPSQIELAKAIIASSEEFGFRPL